MSGGRIKLDLDSILQGYGFLTMLPSGDLLNFGNKGNNHWPLSILVSISVLGQTQNGCLQVSFAKWKTRSDARSNQSVRAQGPLGFDIVWDIGLACLTIALSSTQFQSFVYDFLKMLPLSELLHFGYTGNNYFPLSFLVSISVFSKTQNG